MDKAQREYSSENSSGHKKVLGGGDEEQVEVEESRKIL